MSIGRVGNNQISRSLLNQLQGQLQHQEKLFEQISTNKRILRASDDPTGTSSSMQLRDELSRLNDYEQTAKTGEIWSNVTSASLDSAISTWKRISEIGIAASDGTKSDADRATMGEEMEQLINHLVQISNTTHGGRYIFSGGKTDSPAFEAETDPSTGRVTGVFYRGDGAVREIKTQDGSKITLNVVGSNGGNPNTAGSFVDSRNGVDAFKTAIELRDKLLNNDTIGLSGTGGLLKDIDTVARSFTSAQTRLGGIQEVLELDKNRLIEQNAATEKFLSDIEDADSVQLILELNNAQNVYEAALAVGGRILQMGLLNFI